MSAFSIKFLPAAKERNCPGIKHTSEQASVDLCHILLPGILETTKDLWEGEAREPKAWLDSALGAQKKQHSALT